MHNYIAIRAREEGDMKRERALYSLDYITQCDFMIMEDMANIYLPRV